MSEISTLLLHGPLDAATLMSRLGISQATLSRALSAQPQVLKFGRARATRYALLRPVREESYFPLWRIDEQGLARRAGGLYSIWPAGSCVIEDSQGNWQQFDGLPWYLSDMRPQGFLGRAWGKECALRLGLPEDIRQWNEDHCLIALSRRGSEMPGNWLIGEQSYQQWLRQPVPEIIRQQEKRHSYPQLAEKVMIGEDIGSSAGGEQPKFACCVELPGGGCTHLLVKFTPPQRNQNSQRWRDLLHAEALALQLMTEWGLASAQASIVSTPDGQTFLEVARFDRLAERGRKGLVSLEAVQAEFSGTPTRWPQALQGLAGQKLISPEDAARGILQWAFGRLIANGDMHSGNLAFFHGASGLVLTPAYDMLPMSFAPNSSGHMREVPPKIELDAAVPREVWQQALAMAQQYWRMIVSGSEWSEDFRKIAVDMQQTLVTLEPHIHRMA
ncbi:type II toxin-antitoxin system HipA family toxin YjjJ [Kalamiella sp. sgz302252]|uniref:type II toxin-antitoxin system HipA family toxin YjjJ n=1 Tax=Pantoea sp. sgz302252 TaxID=3341827 RepID=UPI0036D33A0A